MPWLKDAYPWLYPRYVELYGSRSYAPRSYTEQVGERFARLRLRHGLSASGGSRAVPASREQRSRWPSRGLAEWCSLRGAMIVPRQGRRDVVSNEIRAH